MNKEIFDIWLKKNYNELVIVTTKVCSSTQWQHKNDLDDVLHEIIIQLYDNIDKTIRLLDEGKLMFYIVRIVRLSLTSPTSSWQKKMYNELHQEALIFNLHLIHSESKTADDYYDEIENMALVKKIKTYIDSDHFTEKERYIFYEHTIKSRVCKDIDDELGYSINYSQTVYTRVLKRLERYLDKGVLKRRPPQSQSSKDKRSKAMKGRRQSDEFYKEQGRLRAEHNAWKREHGLMKYNKYKKRK